MKNYVDFNPIRSLTSLGVLLQAVLLLAATQGNWGPDALVQAEVVLTAALALVGTFFIEGKSVSKVALQELADADAEAPLRF